MGAHPLVVDVTSAEHRVDRGTRRVLRGGVINMAGAVVSAALNLALIVAIARAFSQETAGLLFSATSVFLIMTAVANLGAPDGLVYFIARLRVFGRPGGVPALLRLAMGPAVVTASLVSVLLLVFADPLADALGPEEAAAYLRILALFLPFAVLTDTALAATRAHHDMSATVLVDRVGRPLAQLALVGMIALTGSVGLLALAWAGPYLPAAVLAWFWVGRLVRRSVPESVAVPPDDEGPVTPARFWAFSLPRALGGVAQMGVQRGGVVMVALLGGLSGAAVFTAATRIMVVGQFGTQAVLYAAQPRFVELLASEDHSGVRSLYQAGTAWLVCLNWPLYLSALVFAPEVMRLFGDVYATGAVVLVTVCLGQLTGAVLGMGDLVLTMTGRTGLNLLNNLLSLLANVGVCLLLVPSHGAVGAAVALVIAVLVRKTLPLWQLRSLAALHPVSRPVLVAVGCALVWFGGLPLVVEAMTGGGLPALGISIAAGVLGHLASLWWLRDHLSLRSWR
ncbi:oligosaccharide flippase family protein [Nocardiopsis alba]|uniref:Oligosaccharide flippase family protein n=1 Tax=Nocardiopsis alba TaxID=53437 RepID=A0A7K2IQL7_9ACTN|nr:oligosaccharide flippase family protein [Nocardiopsis alba]